MFYTDPDSQRVFMVEHGPEAASPVVRIISKAAAPQAAATINALIRTGFDLRREYPVRWIAVLDGSTLELYVVSHHIAMDGMSMSALSVELFELLRYSADGQQKSVDVVAYSQAHLYEVSFSGRSIPARPLIMVLADGVYVFFGICRSKEILG